MKQTADVMARFGLNASSVNVPGQAGPLRIAEGVDAIQNIVNSANAETTASASGYLLCSIVQAGGLLYFFIVLSIVSVLLVFMPFFNFLSQLMFDAGCVIFASAARNTLTDIDGNSQYDPRTVQKVNLYEPKTVRRDAKLASFLTRRARGTVGGISRVARGVYRARNLPRRLPGFALSQKIAVRGGVGLNKAALNGARRAARGTARGAIGIGRGTYRAGKATTRMNEKTKVERANEDRATYRGTLEGNREQVRNETRDVPQSLPMARPVPSGRVPQARLVKPSSAEGSVLGDRRRQPGPYKDSVDIAVEKRNTPEQARWLRLPQRDEAPIAPVQNIPVVMPVARRIPDSQRVSSDKTTPAQPVQLNKLPSSKPDDSNPFNDPPGNPFDRPSPEAIAKAEALFAPSSAHPDHGEAGPIIDYYLSPKPTDTKLVPDANGAWDTLTGVDAQVYSQRGIDEGAWLASLHAAFNQRTVSKQHSGMLFAMGFNANVPWVVQFSHGRDAPFARCNREFAVRLFDTITRDSSKTAFGGCIISKRVFVDWYNEDVLSGRAKAQGFYFVATHEESTDNTSHQSTPLAIRDSRSILPLSKASRGFLTSLFTTKFRHVPSEETYAENDITTEYVDDTMTMYESDLDSVDERSCANEEDTELHSPHSAEPPRRAEWSWNLGI
jgi:hypothetical protein